MKTRHIIAAALCLVLCRQALAQTLTMDDGLSALTTNLVTQIKDHGKKKVAVIDFTDLQGGSSELGRYIAEELTLNLVAAKRDFAVLDRANLKRILAEHKLTSQGLVDPENAKKLGQFAGVDALILGNIIPLSQNIELTAKAITTDTAEIIGAAKVKFKADEDVQKLLSHTATESPGEGAGVDSGNESNTVKSLGDLRIELEPLHIVNGSQILLTMSLKNQNPKTAIRVGPTEQGIHLNAHIFDSAHTEFLDTPGGMSGMQPAIFTTYHYAGDVPSPRTEIKPNESISVTVKFQSFNGGPPAKGTCDLQMELLVQTGSGRDIKTENLTAKIQAN